MEISFTPRFALQDITAKREHALQRAQLLVQKAITVQLEALNQRMFLKAATLQSMQVLLPVSVYQVLTLHHLEAPHAYSVQTAINA
jgi:hypothetical protein